MEEIKKYTVGGEPMIRFYEAGELFNVSPFLGETLARYPVEGACGDVLFPPIRVNRGPLGNVPIFGQSDNRLEPTERSPGVEPNLVGVDVTSVRVHMKSRAVASWIPVEYERADEESWQLRKSSALHNQGLLVLDKEKKAAAFCNSPSNVSTAFVPNSAWNASANAGDAVKHIETLFSHVGSSAGLRPDRLVFGTEAWTMFCSNSSAISRTGGFVTQQRVAELFRVNTVGISEIRANVGVGVNVRRYSPVFPGDVVVAFRAGNPGAFEGRWAMTAVWRPTRYEFPGRYLAELHQYSRRNSSTKVEVGTWEAEAIIDPQLGAIIKGVGSAQ